MKILDSHISSFSNVFNRDQAVREAHTRADTRNLNVCSIDAEPNSYVILTDEDLQSKMATGGLTPVYSTENGYVFQPPSAGLLEIVKSSSPVRVKPLGAKVGDHTGELLLQALR